MSLKYDINYVKGCHFPLLVRDGHCNDETNNFNCNFDGGDCCYSYVSKFYCTSCKCLTGNYGQSNNILIGDGYCQDGLNNAVNNYDNGDCCGPNVNTSQCYDCFCFCW